jgi:hypothetical protein
MLGGGLEAVVITGGVELLLGSGSGVTVLTAAVLLIRVPLAKGQFTLATRVITSELPAATEANVTVRLLPEPLQMPAPVEEHETKVVVAGKTSDIVTFVAALVPLLVTVIV